MIDHQRLQAAIVDAVDRARKAAEIGRLTHEAGIQEMVTHAVLAGFAVLLEEQARQPLAAAPAAR